MKIGEIIKDLREEKELGVKELAKELDVSFKTIYRWENGAKEPQASNIIKLADFFGVTADYILGREK